MYSRTPFIYKYKTSPYPLCKITWGTYFSCTKYILRTIHFYIQSGVDHLVDVLNRVRIKVIGGGNVVPKTMWKKMTKDVLWLWTKIPSPCSLKQLASLRGVPSGGKIEGCGFQSCYKEVGIITDPLHPNPDKREAMRIVIYLLMSTLQIINRD